MALAQPPNSPTEIIASDYQSDVLIPDSWAPMLQSDHIQTMNAWGMPADLPLPVAESNGVFVPATGKAPDIGSYDPWTWAQPQRILDHSKPESGLYGEVSTMGNSGSIVAEWGGMPKPVRDYQDQVASVALVRRQMYDRSGPAGQFNGPAQTAWESLYASPSPDYWSTLTLQG